MKLNLLIVEDNHDTAELWGSILSSMCNVTKVTSALDAVDAIDRGQDILLTDWYLADNSTTGGQFVLAHWSKRGGGPAMVVSGMLPIEEKYELYQRGAWHTFQKPFQIEILTAVVSRYVDGIITKRGWEATKKEITKLRRQLWMLAIILASFVGPEALKWVLTLF